MIGKTNVGGGGKDAFEELFGAVEKGRSVITFSSDTSTTSFSHNLGFIPKVMIVYAKENMEKLTKNYLVYGIIDAVHRKFDFDGNQINECMSFIVYPNRYYGYSTTSLSNNTSPDSANAYLAGSYYFKAGTEYEVVGYA